MSTYLSVHLRTSPLLLSISIHFLGRMLRFQNHISLSCICGVDAAMNPLFSDLRELLLHCTFNNGLLPILLTPDLRIRFFSSHLDCFRTAIFVVSFLTFDFRQDARLHHSIAFLSEHLHFIVRYLLRSRYFAFLASLIVP